MANALIDVNSFGVKTQDEKVFEITGSTGNYLPRLQLMTSSSEKCKAGEFPVNNYALVVGQTFHDLGKEVDTLVIGWRPKAIDMSGDVIISTYDATHADFAKIMEKADIKDSKCMFGHEYLVWVPSKGKFATMFFGSKSARKESPSVKALIGNACTFKSKKIETPKYTWFVPTGNQCNTPFDLPPMEDIKVELDKFMNPPKQEVEKADEPAAGGRAR